MYIKQKITLVRLETVMKSMGQNPDKKELEAIMREVDTDGNGYIDCGISFSLALNVAANAAAPDEFVQLMQIQTSRHSEEEAADAWKLFDKKGKGSISAADFR